MRALLVFAMAIVTHSGCDTYEECGSGYCVGPARLEFSPLGPRDTVLPYDWQRFEVTDPRFGTGGGFAPEEIEVVSHPPGAFVVEVAAVFEPYQASRGVSEEVTGCRGTGEFADISVDCLISANIWVARIHLEVRRSPEHPADRPAVGSLRVETAGRFFSTPLRLGPPEPRVERIEYLAIPCATGDSEPRRTSLTLANTGAAPFHATHLDVGYGTSDTTALWTLTVNGEAFDLPTPPGEVPMVFTVLPNTSIELGVQVVSSGPVEPRRLVWKDADGRSWGASAALYDACP